MDGESGDRLSEAKILRCGQVQIVQSVVVTQMEQARYKNQVPTRITGRQTDRQIVVVVVAGYFSFSPCTFRLSVLAYLQSSKV